MERLITPGSTFFMKFLFPAIWFGFLVMMSGMLFFLPDDGARARSPWIGLFSLVIAFGVGIAFLVPFHFPLKKVWIVDDGLKVSNYRRSIFVPFRSIESITQRVEINFRYIVVRLVDETEFGRRFTMLPIRPKMPWPFSRGEDAIVDELRKLAKLGEGRGGVGD